jgi:hypothetical protein
MRRLTALILPVALLAGCADPGYRPQGPGAYPPSASQPVGPYTGAPAGSYIGPQAAYACEDLTNVLVQPGIGSATATLNSGLDLRLPHQGGGWYGMPNYEFRIRATDAVWTVAGRPPVLCRRK